MKEQQNKTGDERQNTRTPKPGQEKTQTVQPAEALQRFSGGSHKPANVLALQKSVGNKAVTNMIQRHSSDAMERYSFWVARNPPGRLEDGLWHSVVTMRRAGGEEAEGGEGAGGAGAG